MKDLARERIPSTDRPAGAAKRGYSVWKIGRRLGRGKRMYIVRCQGTTIINDQCQMTAQEGSWLCGNHRRMEGRGDG